MQWDLHFFDRKGWNRMSGFFRNDHAVRLLGLILLVLSLFLSIDYNHTGSEAAYLLLIGVGTLTYHIVVRIIIGESFKYLKRNRANLTNPWYRTNRCEQELQKKLKVRHWKDKLPTYDTEAFDPRQHSWTEIAQAMCQSELVHECCAVASLLPILMIPYLGHPVFFLLSSVLPSLIDLSFVMVQRYNRPRVMKVIEKEERLKEQQSEKVEEEVHRAQ